MAIRSLPSKVKSVSGTMCCGNWCKVQFSLVFHSVFSKSVFFYFHQFIFFLESILKCPVQLQSKICCVSRTNQRCSLSSQFMITEAADDVSTVACGCSLTSRGAKNSSLCFHLVSLCRPSPVFKCGGGAGTEAAILLLQTPNTRPRPKQSSKEKAAH